MVLLRTIYSEDCERLLGCSQVELLGESDVARIFRAAEIGQQPAALANELEQAAPRRFIVLVRAQVLVELVDTVGQDRDLHFGRSGVGIVTVIRLNQIGLLLFC